jgi:hypothetical protein
MLLQVLAVTSALVVDASAPAQEEVQASASAQPVRANVLSVTAWKLLSGTLELEYERVIAPQWTVHVAPSWGIGSYLGARSPVDGALMRSLDLELMLGARFYPRGALSGFHLDGVVGAGLYRSRSSSVTTSEDGTVRASRPLRVTVSYQSGMLLGYSWVVADRWSLALAAGGSYAVFDTRDEWIGSGGRSRPFSYWIGTVNGLVRTSLGVAF